MKAEEWILMALFGFLVGLGILGLATIGLDVYAQWLQVTCGSK